MDNKKEYNMKKLLISTLAVLFSILGQAQEHLTFKGVPIDGTLDEYVTNMQEAGFEFLFEENGIAMLKGEFAGYRNCRIGVITLKSIDIVNRITVLFESHNDWNSIYNNYESLKTMLKQKYGKRVESVETFEGYTIPKSDSEKMLALTMERCTYYTTWSTDKGIIGLEIINDDVYTGRVRLSYIDGINTIKVEEKAMDDL